MNKREQKKQTILDIARKIFLHLGFNKTTMYDIANSARMGKATLYHYFHDKEQLFYEVVWEEAKTMQNAINIAIQDISNPKDRLRIYITVRIEYLNRLAITYSALRDKYLEHLTSVKKFRADFIDYETQTLTSIFRDGIDKKIFAVMNINEIIKIFTFALRGMELYMITDSAVKIDQQEIDMLTDTMLFGICK